MARWGELVEAHVLVLSPVDLPADWAETDIWRSAAAIPGVSVTRDEGGREADLFNVSSSGETLLYDAQGRLRFSGGITTGRGHSGASEGRDAITALLTRGAAARSETPVFGCSMRDPVPDVEKAGLR